MKLTNSGIQDSKGCKSFPASFQDSPLFFESFKKISLLENHAFNIKSKYVTPCSLKECNALYANLEKQLEKEYTLSLLNKATYTWETYPLYERFKRLIYREKALMETKNIKNVLFIGGGYFPISSLIYWQSFGIKSTCVDHDAETTIVAAHLMEKLGLTNKIDIQCARGESIDISSFDLIVIALLAHPKQEILKNIRENSVSNIPVICRTSEKSRILLYKPVEQADLVGWKVLGRAEAGLDDTISSLFLEKDL